MKQQTLPNPEIISSSPALIINNIISLGATRAVTGVCGAPLQVVRVPCLKLFNLYLRSIYLFVLYTQCLSFYKFVGVQIEKPNNQMHIQFLSQLKDIITSFIEDTLQDGYIDIILYVFFGTRARRGKFGVQAI